LNPLRQRSARRRWKSRPLATLGILLAVCVGAWSASALERFHFEPPYLFDPPYTVRDHSLIFEQGMWHCFYIRGDIPFDNSTEDEIGHAVSEDLREWTILDPAIVAGPDAWDLRNVWAPHVIPTPGQSNAWTMFLTGANNSVVQRMGVATSMDLDVEPWSKSGANPVLQPDEQEWYWSPSMSWSAFRDPFYFFLGGQHHVLNTALLPDSTLGSGRRGAIHHATSGDFVNWTEQAPLAVHNGPNGQAWHEIESVQLHQAAGKWHLLFSEFNIAGSQFLSSDFYDSGWDFTKRQTYDAGTAPELLPLDNDTFLLTRHVIALHIYNGTTFWSIRADSLRFDSTPAPYVVKTNVLAGDWTVVSGNAFMGVPVFGDNSLERNEAPTQPIGNGYISSLESYGGPLSGFGAPGANVGVAATGLMRSRSFNLSGDRLRMRVGGGSDPGVAVRLVRASDQMILASANGNGVHTMSEVLWDLSGWTGTEVYLEIEDNSVGPNGYIHVDEIVEELIGSPAPGPYAGIRAARLLANAPNPFNPRTQLRWAQTRPGRAGLALYDLRGRRVREFDAGFRDPGEHFLMWDATDRRGEAVASGVYLLRLSFDGIESDRRSVTLVR
jgi:hypothetical protein